MGMIVGRVKVGEQSWRVVGVYVNGNMEETLRGIEGWVEERERGVYSLIGETLMRGQERREGDGGRGDGRGEEEEGRRRSKDGKMNKDGNGF